ncbi:hypothetical protein DICPUDRAFT_26608 [Dictyostelium purpureum]|uniref:Ribonuclease n=1 Tax=Dictyostelium purpureum TaxID=5786 RepID=F0Z8W3_DICPU|nr:uncharacterized protein DICPUDRAFT_26608 [Dictyostelium purpureum]EGC39614.1 hypothetical protein DICPUDRAFT_26608 [Dictyostelium purpureum]|eukprot:XP_003283835.1 hypothetical protein DICPUDRAFT_26608 [Dictyostelium purpureum]
MKHFSDIDKSIDITKPFIMGIDEAGRGPVMGPLVYGCCFAPISETATISKMKFNDSKKLTEQQRNHLFQKMCDSNKILGFEVDVISPEILSEKMLLKKPISLNVISHESAMGLIRSVLSKGINVQELYLDTVGTPATYQAMLKNHFPEISKIVVSKKADSLYPIVSAASICAKVIRDHEITSKNFDDLEIQDEDDQLSTEFGSGYPSDPVTKFWLTKNRDKVFGYPSFIRFSWSTADNAMRGNCFGVEWNLDKSTKISETMFNDIAVGQKRKRFTFFNDNNLENCINDF